jgi:hypothetical protein
MPQNHPSNIGLSTLSNPDAFWELEINIPQLKNYDKYGEQILLGILSDRNPERITMPQQGSIDNVSQDQVWVARFISYDEFIKSRNNQGKIGCIFWTLALICVGYLLLFFANLFASSFPTSNSGGSMFNNIWSGIIYGFIAAWIIGVFLNLIREAKARWESPWDITNTQKRGIRKILARLGF